MAFVSAQKTRVYANGYDVSCLLSEMQPGIERDVADTSTFCDTWKQYVVGLSDSKANVSGFYDGTGSPDLMLWDALGSASRSIWVFHPFGDVVGNVAYGISADETKYEVSSSVTDAVKVAIELQSSTSLERLYTLHAKGQETATGNAGTQDNLVASSLGVSGYLEVFAANGTWTIKLQHSVDNTAWTDLAVFTGVTAITKERVAVSGNVNRYVRATHTVATTGTISYYAGVSRK